jgi:predicted TPR repeat methyltransferase
MDTTLSAVDGLVRERLRRLAPQLLHDLDGAVLTIGDLWTEVPGAPAPIALDAAPDSDAIDHLVSAGHLWAVEDLDHTLAVVHGRLGDAGLLHFLEPTRDAHLGKPLPRLRFDLTERLWAGGFSVIEVRRFDVRGEWGIPWPIAMGVARRNRGPG